MSTALTDWLQAWHDLGAPAADEVLHRRLQDCYSEEHRHYHTLHHLRECFARFEPARHLAQHPAEVRLALWFHDAFYEPQRQDNEVRSAQWARISVLEKGLAPEVAARIDQLVMATRHDSRPEAGDAQLLVDIDLSILGADPDRFDEFELQVRQEYAHVPEQRFREGRKHVLASFHARPRVFATEWFHAAPEEQARDNLARGIARL